ncbi:hypothetical protein V0288_24960 [Pannus brasiliensis CCIBt3594]|uniref:Uncharacterized protein n=1 Tax=Pannus brasiliensis CCIBt3594 TaxID=1427578 RepID=A0AAW9QRH6_9CHRO
MTFLSLHKKHYPWTIFQEALSPSVESFAPRSLQGVSGSVGRRYYTDNPDTNEEAPPSSPLEK